MYKQQKIVISIITLPFSGLSFMRLKSVLSTPLSALSDKIGRKKVISTGCAFMPGGFAFSDYVPE